MKEKIKNKIEERGLLYVIKRVFLKLINIFLLKTGIYKFVNFKTNFARFKYRNTSLTKALFEIRDLHDVEVLEIKDLIKVENPTIIDIGANIGTISLPLAKFFPAGKIYSFEANPNIFTVFYENIILNKLNNIVAICSAVSDKYGFVQFSNKKADDIGVINILENNLEDDENILVPSIKLDDLFKDIKVVDLLKIDVEGFEIFILKNSIETLKKTRAVHCEYFSKNTESFGYKKEEIKKFLEEAGFDCYIPTLKDRVVQVENLIAINKLF